MTSLSAGAPGQTPRALVHKPGHRQGRRASHGRAHGQVQVFRVVQDRQGVASRRRRQYPARGEQHLPVVAPAQPGVERLVEDPGDHSRHYGGEQHVYVGVVHGVQAAKGVLGAQVEDAVCANGRGRTVVEIEEPDGAVHNGEPHCQQGVHRADREAVESELQRLARRLAYLPANIEDYRRNQRCRQQPAPVVAGPHTPAAPQAHLAHLTLRPAGLRLPVP